MERKTTKLSQKSTKFHAKNLVSKILTNHQWHLQNTFFRCTILLFSGYSITVRHEVNNLSG